MITQTKSYASSDGVLHQCLKEAQEQEIRELLRDRPMEDWPAALVAKAGEVVKILSMKERGRPTAAKAPRKSRGPRKAKTATGSAPSAPEPMPLAAA